MYVLLELYVLIKRISPSSCTFVSRCCYSVQYGVSYLVLVWLEIKSKGIEKNLLVSSEANKRKCHHKSLPLDFGNGMPPKYALLVSWNDPLQYLKRMKPYPFVDLIFLPDLTAHSTHPAFD